MQTSKLYILVFIVANEYLFVVQTTGTAVSKSASATEISISYNQYGIFQNKKESVKNVANVKEITKRDENQLEVSGYTSNPEVIYTDSESENSDSNFLLLKGKQLQGQVSLTRRSVKGEDNSRDESLYLKHVTTDKNSPSEESNTFTTVLPSVFKDASYRDSSIYRKRKPKNRHTMSEYSQTEDNLRAFEAVESNRMDNVNEDHVERTTDLSTTRSGKGKEDGASSRYDFFRELMKRKNIPSWLLHLTSDKETDSTYKKMNGFTEDPSGSQITSTNSTVSTVNKINISLGTTDVNVTIIPTTSSRQYDFNVTESNLAGFNVTTSRPYDSNVTSSRQYDSNVTAGRTDDSNVTIGRTDDSNVTTDRAEDSNVTTGRAEDSNVTTGRTEDSNVTTGRTEDSNVTTGRTDDSNVTTGRTEDSNVTVSYSNNTNNETWVTFPRESENINNTPTQQLSPSLSPSSILIAPTGDEHRQRENKNDNSRNCNETVIHSTDNEQNNSLERTNHTRPTLDDDLPARPDSLVNVPIGNCSDLGNETNLVEIINNKDGNHSSGCPTCADAENNVKLMRLKMFKVLLARKLRLDPYDVYRAASEWERTIDDRTPKLPLSIMEQTLKDNAREIDKDEFHARDQELIIAGEDMGRDCVKTQVTGCYSFNLKGKFKREVAEAQLWLYKMRDANDVNGQTFTLYELERLKSGRLVQSSMIVSMDTYVEEDWVILNVTRSLRKWVDKRKGSEMLAIRCVTCASRSYRALYGTKLDYKPLLIVKYALNNYLMRNKRSLSCDPRFDCCKRDLMVNFQEIGMYSIIQPRSLSVGYCYGECNGIHQYALNHTAIKQRARWSESLAGQHSLRHQLKPCCAPVILKDIFIMTSDGDGTLVRKLLPKVIVETCGCL